MLDGAVKLFVDPGSVEARKMKKIFISHSCKDRELEEAGYSSTAPEKIPEDCLRFRQLRFAQIVRDTIYRELESHEGMRPLLDRVWLKTGDDWAAKLNRWLAVCDVAVIILTPQALEKSAWVLKEATVVCWRKSVGASIVVMPVWLFVDSEKLQQNGFGPTEIEKIQCEFYPDTRQLTERAAVQIGHQLANKILEGPGASKSCTQDSFAKWVSDVEEKLVKISAKRLKAACEDLRLEMGADEGDAAEPYAEALARELLLCDFDQRENLIDNLANALTDKPGFFKLLAPSWVEARAASHLLYGSAQRKEFAGSGGECTPVLIDLALQDSTLVTDYVRRAFCCKAGVEKRVIDLTVIPVGERGFDETDVLLASIWNGLVASKINRVIERPKDSDPPIFIVLKEWPGDRSIRAATEKFRIIKFIFIKEIPQMVKDDASVRCIEVWPPLDDIRYVDAMAHKQRLESYLE